MVFLKMEIGYRSITLVFPILLHGYMRLMSEIVKIGQLPKLDTPPTPTPASTPVVDINPTLIAAFVTPVISTRLPTFTPPPPLIDRVIC